MRVAASSPLIRFLERVPVQCVRCGGRWHFWTSFGEQLLGCGCRIIVTGKLWPSTKLGEM